MMGDQEGSVAPGDVVVCAGRSVSVSRVVIHPPGAHVGSPIVGDLYAVEAITPLGSRWAGGTAARIGSDLRAHWSR